MLKELEKLLEFAERYLENFNFDERINKAKKCLNFQNEELCVRMYAPFEHSPTYSMEECHSDFEKMMFNELCSAISNVCIPETCGLPAIRANYGVGILPSVFGAKSKIVAGNMPWVDPISKEEIKKHISAGVPDYRNGFGQRIIDTYSFYNEILSEYPNCKKNITLYHPDFQGPFDVAHLIYGSDIYVDIYEDPELVHALLELVTNAYIDGMRKMKELINDEPIDGYVVHWSSLFKGRVLLRNDTAVNISKDSYLEFVKPYDDKILEAFGGGSMHYCGQAKQWFGEMAKSELLGAMNFGQPPNMIKDFRKVWLDYAYNTLRENNKAIVDYNTQNIKEISKFYKKGIIYTCGSSSLQSARELYEQMTCE